MCLIHNYTIYIIIDSCFLCNLFWHISLELLWSKLSVCKCYWVGDCCRSCGKCSCCLQTLAKNCFGGKKKRLNPFFSQVEHPSLRSSRMVFTLKEDELFYILCKRACYEALWSSPETRNCIFPNHVSTLWLVPFSPHSHSKVGALVLVLE